VTERLEGAGIRVEPLAERVVAPREWRDSLALPRGAVFGLAHSLEQASIVPIIFSP